MTFEKLINELATNTKRNVKIQLLKENDYEHFKEAFKLCFNPFIVFNINKIPKPKQSGSRDFDQTYEKFFELATHLYRKKFTGNEAREIVDIFLRQCKTETANIYISILKKDMRCGVNISTINTAYGKDTIKTFDIQLANAYDSNKKYNVKGWWASKKLDGIRGYYDKGTLLTRSGKQIIGFEHICQELEDLKQVYGLSFIDGEMYSNTLSFQKIQGYVISSKNFSDEDKKKIFFNIFVVGPDSDTRGINYFKNTGEMVELMKQIKWENYKYLVPLQYEYVKNKFDDISNVCERYVNEGYEGAMLRSDDIYYDDKRSDNLLKVKLFKESDFIVTDFIEGTGKHERKLGSFQVKGELDGKQIISNVGSGLSDEDRDTYWKNRDYFLGKLVEIKYQNITDKPNDDGTYSLRFPIFMKFKLDR